MFLYILSSLYSYILLGTPKRSSICKERQINMAKKIVATFKSKNGVHIDISEDVVAKIEEKHLFIMEVLESALHGCEINTESPPKAIIAELSQATPMLDAVIYAPAQTSTIFRWGLRPSTNRPSRIVIHEQMTTYVLTIHMRMRMKKYKAGQPETISYYITNAWPGRNAPPEPLDPYATDESSEYWLNYAFAAYEVSKIQSTLTHLATEMATELLTRLEHEYMESYMQYSSTLQMNFELFTELDEVTQLMHLESGNCVNDYQSNLKSEPPQFQLPDVFKKQVTEAFRHGTTMGTMQKLFHTPNELLLNIRKLRDEQRKEGQTLLKLMPKEA